METNHVFGSRSIKLDANADILWCSFTKWWFVLFSHRFIINQIFLTVALKSKIFFFPVYKIFQKIFFSQQKYKKKKLSFYLDIFSVFLKFSWYFASEIMPVFLCCRYVNIIYVCSPECDILHKCGIDVEFMYETFVLFKQWCMCSTTIFPVQIIFQTPTLFFISFSYAVLDESDFIIKWETYILGSSW